VTALDQPGTFPIWVLNGRPSASADAARLREIERIAKLTPIERIAMALESYLPTRGRSATNDAEDPRELDALLARIPAPSKR